MILDKHAPLRKRVITIRPRAPWYSEEIKEQKVIFHRIERRWRFSRLTIFKSKMVYYSSLIYSAESDSKTLFRTITRLPHWKADKLFPTSSSAVDLANKFVHFFEEKIVNIRSNLGTPVIPDFFRTLDTSSLTCQLVNFAPTSNTELSNIANNIIMKSCILVPLSSTLLNQHLDFFLPINLKIVNLSLESGHFPSLKSAVLSPLLKKANLHHEVLANYKPISNLKVISKIIEKVVAVRLQKYLEANQLNEPLQSAHKPFHSCETALVRVHNDILVAINKSHYVMLLLLDLSAAFDTDRSQSLAVYLKVLSLDRFCMNSTQLH